VAADMLITRREGMIEAEVDGDLVGLNVATGTCFGFNLTAKRVWRLLEQPQRMSELTAALTAEFAIGEAECTEQVSALLEELREEGLVTLTPAGEASGQR
jgi:hypothetical protein